MLDELQNCNSKFHAVDQTISRIKFEDPRASPWSTVNREQFSLKIPQENPMGNLNMYKQRNSTTDYQCSFQE